MLWFVAAVLVAGAALEANEPPVDHGTHFAVGFSVAKLSENVRGLEANATVRARHTPTIWNLGSCGQWADVTVRYTADRRFLLAVAKLAPPPRLPTTTIAAIATWRRLRKAANLGDEAAHGRWLALDQQVRTLTRQPYVRAQAPTFAVAVADADAYLGFITGQRVPNHFQWQGPTRELIEGAGGPISRGGLSRDLRLDVDSRLTMLSREKSDFGFGSFASIATRRDLLGQLGIYADEQTSSVSWTVSFAAPVVARHGFASCWVRVPEIASIGSRTIALGRSQAAGAVLDRDASRPRPTVEDTAWNCSRRNPTNCGAWALVQASWRPVYRDASLIVVGVMLSIAAQLGIHQLGRRDTSSRT